MMDRIGSAMWLAALREKDQAALASHDLAPGDLVQYRHYTGRVETGIVIDGNYMHDTIEVRRILKNGAVAQKKTTVNPKGIKRNARWPNGQSP